MLAGERRLQGLEGPGSVLVGDLDLELGLPRRDVIGLLQVVDPRELDQDLVIADRLDDRLRDAEAVDATIDDPARTLVVIRDALARRDLIRLHLQDELDAALEIQTEVGLDLLVHRESPDPQADARAVEGERELVLGDVDEHREHRDERDGPRKKPIHDASMLTADQVSRWAFRRSRASRISRSNGVSPSGAGATGAVPAARAGVAGEVAGA